MAFIIEVAEADAWIAAQISKSAVDGIQADENLLDALQLAVVHDIHQPEALERRGSERDPGLSELKQHAKRDRHSPQSAEDRRHFLFVADCWAGGARRRGSGSLRRELEAGNDLLFNPSPHLDRCLANLIRRQRNSDHGQSSLFISNRAPFRTDVDIDQSTENMLPPSSIARTTTRDLKRGARRSCYEGGGRNYRSPCVYSQDARDVFQRAPVRMCLRRKNLGWMQPA